MAFFWADEPDALIEPVAQSVAPPDPLEPPEALELELHAVSARVLIAATAASWARRVVFTGVPP
jgi:hypothetical protein